MLDGWHISAICLSSSYTEKRKKESKKKVSKVGCKYVR